MKHLSKSFLTFSMISALETQPEGFPKSSAMKRQFARAKAWRRDWIIFLEETWKRKKVSTLHKLSHRITHSRFTLFLQAVDVFLPVQWLKRRKFNLWDFLFIQGSLARTRNQSSMKQESLLAMHDIESLNFLWYRTLLSSVKREQKSSCSATTLVSSADFINYSWV